MAGSAEGVPRRFGEDVFAGWLIARGIIRVRTAHRVQFVLSTLINMADVASMAIAMAVITHRFGDIAGWGTGDMLLLVAAVAGGYGLSLLVMGGFDSYQFIPMYRNGEFVAALARPCNLIVTLSATSLRPYRAGRLIATALIGVLGTTLSGANPFAASAAIVVAWCTTGVMFSAMWVIDASMTIRLGQLNDLTRMLPYVSFEANVFPLHLFDRAPRLILQYVVGIGSGAYLPLAFVLGKNDIGAWWLLLGPTIAAILVVVASIIWRGAISRFEKGECP